MGSSKQKTTSTETSTRDPYAPSQPLLRTQAEMAGDYLANPGSSAVYGGQRTPGMSDMTRTGMESMFASNGARTSEDYLSRVVGGEYLDAGNPHLAAVQDSVRASVMPNVNSQFSAAGMGGSTLHQGTLTKALTRGMAEPLFANYENERSRQMQAAGTLPGVSQGIIGNQLGAGQIQEGYTQADIDAAREEFEERRTAGLRPLLETLPISTGVGSMGGTSSGTSTQTQSSRPSTMSTILGAGMMGASLFGRGGPLAMLGGAGSGMISGMNAGGGELPWAPDSQGGWVNYRF